MAPVTRDGAAIHVRHSTSKPVLPLILFTQQESSSSTIAPEEGENSSSGQFSRETAFQHTH